MDTDGQHEANNIYEAINLLINKNSDLIIGSRFLDNSSIQGLSKKRKMGSSLANNIAKLSLSKRYHHITDLMSGCIVFNRNKVIKFIKKIDVNGFKFLFELLSVSNGNLTSQEIPLNFLPRKFG